MINISSSGRVCSIIVRKGYAFHLFKKYITPKARILDVGCGIGHFIRQLDKYGYKAEGIDGVDYNQEVVGNLLDPLPWYDNTFDAITVWEVFEHLENPRFLIREINRVLKPNGYLFFSTPNHRHIESRIHFFLKGELWRWNEKNDHFNIWTGSIVKKSFPFLIIEHTTPHVILGKYGILGRIRQKIKSIDKLLPENSWFGWFDVYVMRKLWK